MNKNYDMESKSKGKKYLQWSNTVEEDGFTKKVTVEEIENGYIVCLKEYGFKGEEYIDTYKKQYSEKNPLEGLKPDTGTSQEEITDTIKNFLDY